MHDHIQRHQAQLPSSLRSAPVQIMIVANKTDQAREVSTEEGRLLAEQLGCQFVETCAKDCANMQKACSDFIRQIRRGQQDGRGCRDVMWSNFRGSLLRVWNWKPSLGQVVW